MARLSDDEKAAFPPGSKLMGIVPFLLLLPSPRPGNATRLRPSQEHIEHIPTIVIPRCPCVRRVYGICDPRDGFRPLESRLEVALSTGTAFIQEQCISDMRTYSSSAGRSMAGPPSDSVTHGSGHGGTPSGREATRVRGEHIGHHRSRSAPRCQCSKASAAPGIHRTTREVDSPRTSPRQPPKTMEKS